MLSEVLSDGRDPTTTLGRTLLAYYGVLLGCAIAVFGITHLGLSGVEVLVYTPISAILALCVVVIAEMPSTTGGESDAE